MEKLGSPLLLKEMKELGSPEYSLIRIMDKDGKQYGVIGDEEYGDREKANRLVGTQGLVLVKSLLEQLQEKDQACWPIGFRMLADRLAYVAGQKEEGR